MNTNTARVPRMAVAATSKSALHSLGRVLAIPGMKSMEEVVLVEPNKSLDIGSYSIWCVPKYTQYRNAYIAAFDQYKNQTDPNGTKFCEWAFDISTSSENNMDLDHLYPKSWAIKAEHHDWWLRMHPVFFPVNRQAGASMEKCHAFEFQKGKEPANGIVYALSYQLLKLLQHPVGNKKSGYEDQYFGLSDEI